MEIKEENICKHCWMSTRWKDFCPNCWASVFVSPIEERIETIEKYKIVRYFDDYCEWIMETDLTLEEAKKKLEKFDSTKLHYVSYWIRKVTD